MGKRLRWWTVVLIILFAVWVEAMVYLSIYWSVGRPTLSRP